MEQHPVPQNISTFEFKLFGNLTIRQFFTLIVPASIAALIFFSKGPVLIRYTASVVIGAGGAFIALVPINGRPFDKWLVSFIKAILAPTQRIWTKEKNLPDFLTVVVAPAPVEEKIPEAITAQGRERLKAYLASLPQKNETPLDRREEIAIQRLNLDTANEQEGTLPPPIIWSTPRTIQPQEIPKPQIIKGSDSLKRTPTVVSELAPELIPDLPIRAKISDHAKPFIIPGVEKRLEESALHVTPINIPRAHLASETNSTIDNIFPVHTGDQIAMITGVGRTRVRKLHFAPPPGFNLSNMPIRGEKRFEVSDELKKRYAKAEDIINAAFAFNQPPPAPVTIRQDEPLFQPQKIYPEQEQMESNRRVSRTPKQIRFSPKIKPTLTKPILTHPQITKNAETDYKIAITNKKSIDTQNQQTSTKANIVPLTNKPNVLSGQITDAGGSPLEAAVLIVRDTNGTPIRALKTNKLGQFLSATPLTSGNYTIEIESAVANFKPQTLNLIGEILMPLEIRAQN